MSTPKEANCGEHVPLLQKKIICTVFERHLRFVFEKRVCHLKMLHIGLPINNNVYVPHAY